MNETPPGPVPDSLRQAYWFSAFKALSFQVVLGGPMVLYARELGASATVLGIVAGMMPLLTIAQLPAAQHIPRVGYKRFVVGGWTTRVAFIFAMAALPLLPEAVNAPSRLALLVCLLFAFNLSRGISSCAWLPWITQIVPATIRGRYLARDQLCLNAASWTAFAFAALVLGADPTPARFAAVFLFSAVAGTASLRHLRRIPDHPVPPDERSRSGPVPWRALAAHPPFRKLLRMNIAWSIAYGGLTPFIVAFLRTGAGLPEGRILWLLSFTFLGGLASFWLAGPRLDRLGSKPALGFTMAGGMVATLGWGLMAGGVLPVTALTGVPLAVLTGLVNSLFAAANSRLAMTIMPAMGRNHFFALFAVVWQLSLGLSPIAWGLALDLIGDRRAIVGGVDWNRYSVFFAATLLAFAAAFERTRRLDEPTAGPAHALLRELLIDLPRRLLPGQRLDR